VLRACFHADNVSATGSLSREASRSRLETAEEERFQLRGSEARRASLQSQQQADRMSEASSHHSKDSEDRRSLSETRLKGGMGKLVGGAGSDSDSDKESDHDDAAPDARKSAGAAGDTADKEAAENDEQQPAGEKGSDDGSKDSDDDEDETATGTGTAGKETG